jgi:hypothetical protein
MWVSYTITASKAQNFLLMQWLPLTLFGISSPPSPKVALRRAEKTKFEKYSEGVTSRPNIRLIPFAITEFGTLGGHATVFLTELAKQAAAYKGMHVGKLLASKR